MAFNRPTIEDTRQRDQAAYFEIDGQIVRAVGLANFQQLADAISGEGGERLIEFGESLSVAASAQSILLNITVPPLETYVIGNILVSGSRIGVFDVLLDDVVIARKRTWYDDFNKEINIVRADFLPGENIKVRVTNNDSTKPGDFEATITGVKR